MPRSPTKGEVYFYNDDVNKERPLMILSVRSANGGDYAICAPFYSSNIQKKLTYPWGIFFAQGECNLSKDSCLCLNLTALHTLGELSLSNGPLGRATEQKLLVVDAGLKVLFGIDGTPMPPKQQP